jgi:hypothetical protein
MVWFLLLLALVSVKANRTPKAWLIFIPLLIVMFLWFLLKKAIPLDSSITTIYDQVISSLAIGISIIFLLGHKIGNRHRFVTFLLAMLIMILVCAVGLVSFGESFFRYGIPFAATSMLLIAAILLTFVLAGFKCRKKYGPVRFMLWLAIWMIGGVTASILILCTVAFTIASIMGEELPVSWLLFLMQVISVGLILGGALYAVALPFMIFVLNNSFFRGRFFACLHLKSMPTASNAAEPVARIADPENQDDVNLP